MSKSSPPSTWAAPLRILLLCLHVWYASYQMIHCCLLLKETSHWQSGHVTNRAQRSAWPLNWAEYVVMASFCCWPILCNFIMFVRLLQSSIASVLMSCKSSCGLSSLTALPLWRAHLKGSSFKLPIDVVFRLALAWLYQQHPFPNGRKEGPVWFRRFKFKVWPL